MSYTLPDLRSILVSGSEYKLRYLNTEEVEDNYGLCSRIDPKFIAIDPTLQGKQLMDTLVHEVIHAVMWERRITHSLTNAIDLEEFVTTHLATGLVEVLRDNKKLSSWILENVHK